MKKRHKPLPARCKKKAPPAKPPSPQAPSSLGTVATTITLPDENGIEQYAMAFGAGALWVSDSHGLLRVDPATNAVAARIAGPNAIYGDVVVDGSVWYDSWDGSAVYRVDPATNAIVAKIPVPAGPEGLAATPGSIWVASHYDWSVSRIDTASNRVVATIPMPGENPDCCGPQRIAATSTGVWVGVPNLNQVVRIDPATNRIAAVISAGVSCGGVAADASSVWVAGASCATGLARIDPATNQVLLHGPIGDIFRATALEIVGESLYVGVLSATTGVERIDPTTNKVMGVLELRSLPTTTDNGGPDLAYGAGSLWVRGPGSVIRIDLKS